MGFIICQNRSKLAYEYLEKEGMLFSIRDEIDDPNMEDSINQLEILARRGYFSIPEFRYEETYDSDGNPIWSVEGHIAEKQECFEATASSKKAAKKQAAYGMLEYVIESVSKPPSEMGEPAKPRRCVES